MESITTQKKTDDKKRHCKPAGGRPRKESSEKLKYRLTVKMATEEYYNLKSKARLAGVTRSEFIRTCVKEGSVRERLTTEQADYIRKLCGMANNLNQLARKANTEGYLSAHTGCRMLVVRIEELLNRIGQ